MLIAAARRGPSRPTRGRSGATELPRWGGSASSRPSRRSRCSSSPQQTTGRTRQRRSPRAGAGRGRAPSPARRGASRLDHYAREMGAMGSRHSPSPALWCAELLLSGLGCSWRPVPRGATRSSPEVASRRCERRRAFHHFANSPGWRCCHSPPSACRHDRPLCLRPPRCSAAKGLGARERQRLDWPRRGGAGARVTMRDMGRSGSTAARP